jgi:hypothetical protein
MRPQPDGSFGHAGFRKAQSYDSASELMQGVQQAVDGRPPRDSGGCYGSPRSSILPQWRAPRWRLGFSSDSREIPSGWGQMTGSAVKRMVVAKVVRLRAMVLVAPADAERVLEEGRAREGSGRSSSIPQPRTRRASPC